MYLWFLSELAERCLLTSSTRREDAAGPERGRAGRVQTCVRESELLRAPRLEDASAVGRLAVSGGHDVTRRCLRSATYTQACSAATATQAIKQGRTQRGRSQQEQPQDPHLRARTDSRYGSARTSWRNMPDFAGTFVVSRKALTFEAFKTPGAVAD